MRAALGAFAGSLRGRLILSAALFVVLSVVAVGWLIASLLDGVLRAEVEGRLDLQLASIAAVLGAEPDAAAFREPPRGDGAHGRGEAREPPPHGRRDGEGGPPPRPRPVGEGLDGPPFDRPESGWAWLVEREGERAAASRSLAGRDLGFDPAALDRGRRRGPPAEAEDAAGRAVVVGTREVAAGPGAPYRITALAPREAIDGPLRGATLTAAGALAALGLLLVGSIALQVRFGLLPIRSLEAALQDIRAGERSGVPADQPRELAPLAAEINALIAHDAETLRQARLHVANLAHGLKTPLATLAAAIDRQKGWPDREALLGLALLMDKRIGHHLRRARSAALDNPVGARTAVAQAARDLVFALEKMAPGRAVAAELAVPPDLFVLAGEEDLSEMLGNLLDNAWRHARGRVRIAARREGGEARITVEDDGPGLGEGDIEAVLQPGRRLDERSPGFGFGLPITAELAGLNGGSLALARAALGGLSATLTLPAARAAV